MAWTRHLCLPQSVQCVQVPTGVFAANQRATRFEYKFGRPSVLRGSSSPPCACESWRILPKYFLGRELARFAGRLALWRVSGEVVGARVLVGLESNLTAAFLKRRSTALKVCFSIRSAVFQNHGLYFAPGPSLSLTVDCLYAYFASFFRT